MDLFHEVDLNDNATPRGEALDVELTDYMTSFRSERSIKGLNLVVLTDGKADDEDLVEQAIVQVALELKDLSVRSAKRQIGILFVQVGDNSDATRFLKKLDDAIKVDRHLDRDVSTTTFASLRLHAVSWSSIN